MLEQVDGGLIGVLSFLMARDAAVVDGKDSLTVPFFIFEAKVKVYDILQREREREREQERECVYTCSVQLLCNPVLRTFFF